MCEVLKDLFKIQRRARTVAVRLRFFFIKKKGSYINYKSPKFDLSPEWTQRCWFQFDMNSGFCKVFRNVL